MVKSEGYILNRFYVIESAETEAVAKIVQIYTKNQGLITMYVRDIYIDSYLFGKMELFDRVILWWESAKDLANLVDLVAYDRLKTFDYEKYMGLSYMAKVIKEDVKFYDEFVYDLFSYFWNYEFENNFYIPILWFLLAISYHFGIRPLFLEKDISENLSDIVGINLSDGNIGFSKYSIKVRKQVLKLLKIISQTDLKNMRDLKFNIVDSKEALHFMLKLFKGLNR